MRDGWGEQNNKYKRNNSDQSQRNGCNNRQDTQTTATEPQHTGQISTVCVGRHYCCWRLSPFFCVFYPLLFIRISPCCRAETKSNKCTTQAMLFCPFCLFYLFFGFFLLLQFPLFLQFARSHCNHTSCMSQYCWAPCVTITISWNSQSKSHELEKNTFFQSSHKKKNEQRKEKENKLTRARNANEGWGGHIIDYGQDSKASPLARRGVGDAGDLG